MAEPSQTSQDLTAGEINLLVEKAGGHDQIRRVLSSELRIQLVSTRGDQGILGPKSVEVLVTVPAQLGFEERIERGHYGWRNSGLTEERFPITPEQFGEQTQKLFHFARSMSSEEAIRRIREDGFEPGQTGDILAFGENFPEGQRKHPVVGLDSVAEVDGKLSVPALWFDGERRTLDAIWYDGDWHRNYRFLGVRRRSVA